jgi:D-beta-D-heptose 7-phosphate kinase/D-beta-D-heptose 1-phosphate adenosyltransferase
MQQLGSYIDDFKNVRALCVGDIMLDEFIYGDTSRVSPEAPVPVVKFGRSAKMLGGAGNVAANLAAMGAKASFFGIVGRDDAGRAIEEKLEEIGVRHKLMHLQGYPTIQKTRIVSGGQQVVRLDREDKLPIVRDSLDKIREILDAQMDSSDIVLLSDYNKGLFTPESAQMIISLAHSHGKQVIIDPKGNDYSKYAGADFIKPNLKEFCEVCGFSTSFKDKDFSQKARLGAARLFKELGIKNLLITLSENGMVLIRPEDKGDPLHIPTEAREVYDVSGAGDTVLASFGLSLAVGADIKDAMRIANKASGIAVGKAGTAAVSFDELRDSATAESGDFISVISHKILSQSAAARKSSELKAKGLSIGFTNGTFDLCHLGHISSFWAAKALCDKLFVGVNSDASVKHRKGEAPAQDEKTRTSLIASIEPVDYVVVFDEDTAQPLVEKIRPDVIAKAGYKLENWPEGRFVMENGGKAVELDTVPNCSTAAIVNRIREGNGK